MTDSQAEGRAAPSQQRNLQQVVASAPGKVNLALRVGATQDGYHHLATVFQALSLREWVEARVKVDHDLGVAAQLPSVTTWVYEVGPSGVPVFSERLTKEMASLDPAQHLAVRAAKALGADGSVELVVHKTIPAAGGMAGGSADAAATLVAVNELLGLGLDVEQLTVVGRKLGADVPACLAGGLTLGTGRGDDLVPLTKRSDLNQSGAEQSDAGQRLGLGEHSALEHSHLNVAEQQTWWALAFSTQGLSTPAVFREFDRGLEGVEAAQTPLARPVLSAGELDALTSPNPQVVASAFVNDLQGAALSLQPTLAGVGKRFEELGALGWLVSGSGPTIAALAGGPDHARSLAQSILGVDGVRSSAVARGPVPGAKLEACLPDWARL